MEKYFDFDNKKKICRINIDLNKSQIEKSYI